MGLLISLHKKTDEQISDGTTAVKGSVIQQAQKAASIVDEGIKNGSINRVSDRLKEYIYTGKSHVVFDQESMAPWIMLRLLGIIGSAGFFCILPVAAGIIAYSTEYRQYGFYAVGIVGAVVVFNILLCRKAGREIRFARRYDHYQNILKYRNVELVKDLAGMIYVTDKIVEEDLNKAVKIKLVPQGHFSADNKFFMVTDEAFARYSASRAEYDQYFNKLIKDRSERKDYTKKAKERFAKSEEYLGRIRDINDMIKDKKVSQKLKRMEKVVSVFSHEVDTNPSHAVELGVFINYYLSTTEKLLKSYKEIEEKQIIERRESKRDREHVLDSINDVFESLLKRYYEEQELDVVDDISAKEIHLKQKDYQAEGDAESLETSMEEPVTIEPVKAESVANERISEEDSFESQRLLERRTESIIITDISPVHYTHTDLPKRKMKAVDYSSAENEAEIKRCALLILQAEAPILKGVLIRKILASFGVNRNNAVLEATEGALKALNIKTTKYDGRVFCWAPDQDPDSYSGLRMTNERSCVEICPQELCNAMIYSLREEGTLPEEALIHKVSGILGYKRLSKNLEAVLKKGVQFARSSGVIVYSGGKYKLPD